MASIFHDIFPCIYFKETILVFIQISLKFVLKGPINNMAALVVAARDGLVPNRQQQAICEPMMA